MKFFATLDERGIFSLYSSSLDWFLSDGKFDKSLWDNKNKVQAFTKALRKLDGVSCDRIHYGSKKNILFPGQGDYRNHHLFEFYFAKGESESKDLIRHIRNGIAHGNIGLYEVDGELMVELLDFGKESVRADGQTAYMVFPLSFLNSVHSLYQQKEQQWQRGVGSKKRRSAK